MGDFRKFRDFQVIESFEKSTLEVKPWNQFVVRELLSFLVKRQKMESKRILNISRWLKSVQKSDFFLELSNSIFIRDRAVSPHPIMTLTHISCFLALAVNSSIINFFYVCMKSVMSEMDSRSLDPCLSSMELLGDYELLCHEGRI